eukprot:1775287-Pyramimonas_sp.AAC.1
MRIEGESPNQGRYTWLSSDDRWRNCFRRLAVEYDPPDPTDPSAASSFTIAAATARPLSNTSCRAGRMRALSTSSARKPSTIASCASDRPRQRHVSAIDGPRVTSGRSLETLALCSSSRAA